jgi:hypothetical protein
VAAGASDLAHPGTARATGIPWQTGVVNSDNETFVEPSNGSFPDPTLLTVRVGISAPFQGLSSTANQAAMAAYDTTGNYVYGLYATSSSGTAVFGASGGIVAIKGSNDSGTAVWGLSNSGSGVEGDSATGTGVYGSSSSHSGVSGSSTSGVGVVGSSISNAGVNGFSNTGRGMVGQSNSNHGVEGQSGFGLGGYFHGGLAPLRLGLGGAPGAPGSGDHSTGDIYLDSLATVWVCIGPGTPGTWVRLLSVPNGTPGGTIQYLSTPVRLLDARTGASSGLVNRGALAGNEIYTFAVAGLGSSGIPSNAQGLIANVTVLGPSGIGNLSLYPTGGAIPTVASMTFGSPGLFLANGVNVGIGSGGAINLQNQSGGITPLVLDAVAYVS